MFSTVGEVLCLITDAIKKVMESNFEFRKYQIEWTERVANINQI